MACGNQLYRLVKGDLLNNEKRGVIMITVRFYEQVANELLKFAVIVSKYNGKWVFCKHKNRDTYECPGGHRESNEIIEDTAKRELCEETGAKIFDLTPICVYSVLDDYQETFGMLYFADIYSFEELPHFEMERIQLFDMLPNDWTYPNIQPILVQKVSEVIFNK